MNIELQNSDYVLTPEFIAKDMIEYFKPTGNILDPCCGKNKVFINNLPPGSKWCEIMDGVDFFNFNEKVDWIIGNPPYSIFDKWMKHSYDIADNIVYFLPSFKIFNALGLFRLYKKQGWIKEIRIYDVGKMVEWGRSRPLIACHFKKKYIGDIKCSWYEYNK